MTPAASSNRAAARDRILAAAVRRIASEGIDEVRIARIAMDAGVSTSLVHYHFETREALLAEALDYSYTRAGDARIESGGGVAGAQSTHAERLNAMVEQCLPTSPSLHDDWVLWVELWLRAVRHPELRPVAEELYGRLHAWFAKEIAAGIRDREFERCDPGEVADRALALIDGYGVRNLIGDSQMPLERAQRAVSAQLARDLGLGERLVPAAQASAAQASPAQASESARSAARAASRPVRTAPSM
jgi:AcrR family transcriptional regulator